MRDEHYTPFQGSDPPPRETITVFVMARLRGDLTDSMRGSLRAGPHGWDAVYLLNGELYRTQLVRDGGAGARRALRSDAQSL